jgi:hypothetical protein
MPKSLIRLFGLILVPCLIADPVVAAGLSAARVSASARPVSTTSFESQAVVPLLAVCLTFGLGMDRNPALYRFARNAKDASQKKRDILPDPEAKVALTSSELSEVGTLLGMGLVRFADRIDAKSWFIRTGMGGNSEWTWWNLLTRLFSHGESVHGGTDLVLYRDSDGHMHGMENVQVPALTSGTIRWVFDDIMGRTVIVQTGSIYVRYMHLMPFDPNAPDNRQENLRPGDSVTAGQIIGIVQRSKNEKSVVAPHLDLGVFTIPQEEDRNTLIMTDMQLNDWARLGKIRPLDVLEIIPAEVRAKLFVEAPEADLKIGPILVVSDEKNDRIATKKMIALAIPGQRDITTCATPAQQMELEKERAQAGLPPFDIVLSREIKGAPEAGATSSKTWSLHSYRESEWVADELSLSDAIERISRLEADRAQRPAAVASIPTGLARWENSIHSLTPQEWGWLFTIDQAVRSGHAVIGIENGVMKVHEAPSLFDYAMRNLNMAIWKINSSTFRFDPRPMLKLAILANLPNKGSRSFAPIVQTWAEIQLEILHRQAVKDPIGFSMTMLQPYVSSAYESLIQGRLRQYHQGTVEKGLALRTLRQHMSVDPADGKKRSTAFAMIDAVLWYLKPSFSSATPARAHKTHYLPPDRPGVLSDAGSKLVETALATVGGLLVAGVIAWLVYQAPRLVSDGLPFDAAKWGVRIFGASLTIFLSLWVYRSNPFPAVEVIHPETPVETPATLLTERVMSVVSEDGIKIRVESRKQGSETLVNTISVAEEIADFGSPAHVLYAAGHLASSEMFNDLFRSGHLPKVSPESVISFRNLIFYFFEEALKNAIFAVRELRDTQLLGSEIIMQAKIRNNEFWLEVTDNGKGIDPTLLDQIGNGRVSDKKRGTFKFDFPIGGGGTALRDIRRRIQEFSGRLVVENRKDSDGKILGARVSLVFPLESDLSAIRNESDKPPTPSSSDFQKVRPDRSSQFLTAIQFPVNFLRRYMQPLRSTSRLLRQAA